MGLVVPVQILLGSEEDLATEAVQFVFSMGMSGRSGEELISEGLVLDRGVFRVVSRFLSCRF